MLKLNIKINQIQYTLKLINNFSKITILDACLNHGVYIPHFCYNKYLQIAGNCRACLIEIVKLVKPIISCLNICIENLSIFTNTFSIKKFRENVLEFLLINHPLDCPICDQAGECDLQEQTKQFGLYTSRFFEKKKTNINIYLNNFIKLILNRCILCVRCIRYLRENNIDSDFSLLGVIGRGSYSKIHLFKSKSLYQIHSSNIIDLCPVGALTLKLNQFTYRPWELNTKIDFDCFDSFGLPIQFDFKNNKIVRILPYLDSIFFVNFISDLTRYNLNIFENLKSSKNIFLNYLNFNTLSSNFNTFLNISNNCFISMNKIKNVFKNIVNLNKFFISNINIVSNFLNFYLFDQSFLINYKLYSLILINKNLKIYMFRFFFYLFNINKNFSIIKFLNSFDFNLYNIFNVYKLKQSLSYSVVLNSYYNKSLNLYIIKFLSFFKILLYFDELLKYKLQNINKNFNKMQNYIDYFKISIKKRKHKLIKNFYIIQPEFDNILIFNILGTNLKNKKMNLILDINKYKIFINILKYSLKKQCI